MLDLLIAWTRVHVIVAVREEIRCSPRVHVAFKVRPCGNIVPHGENRGKFLRLNNRAPLLNHSVIVPPCYQGSTIPVGPPPTCLPCGAPHGRPHGPRDRVASYPVAAPLCASCAPCGPPGLCHVASVPRRTPTRSRAPRQPLLGPLATSACR